MLWRRGHVAGGAEGSLPRDTPLKGHQDCHTHTWGKFRMYKFVFADYANCANLCAAAAAD